MTDLKIGVFAYNFKHWKTQAGIQNLCMAGYKPSVIFAADPVELKFYRSKVRIGLKDQFLWHPKDLAEFYGIDYRVVVHNSEETDSIVRNLGLDVGIILGARILKPIAFSGFKVGVINMHPGILPENRGLDNVKWAIIKGMKQGVTSHLIDSKIDRGHQLMQKTINVYEDDTLVDIHVRVQNLEQELMLDSLALIDNTKDLGSVLKTLEKGTYYKSVPLEIEKNLIEAFSTYKKEMC